MLGKKVKRVRELEHDKLTVFGIVDDYDREELRRVADGLIERRLLARAEGRYATLNLTQAGRTWLRGQDTLALDLPVRETTPRTQSARVSTAKSEDAFDAELFDRLRTERRRLASDENVPAFVVFGDATLRGLAEARPVTPEAILRVSGVGPAKLERYGKAFLAVIRGYLGDDSADSSVGPTQQPNFAQSSFESADRLTEIRKAHPRAYEPWTESEERELERLHTAGMSIVDLAARLGRQPGGVRSRLNRMGHSADG